MATVAKCPANKNSHLESPFLSGVERTGYRAQAGSRVADRSTLRIGGFPGKSAATKLPGSAQRRGLAKSVWQAACEVSSMRQCAREGPPGAGSPSRRPPQGLLLNRAAITPSRPNELPVIRGQTGPAQPSRAEQRRPHPRLSRGRPEGNAS